MFTPKRGSGQQCIYITIKRGHLRTTSNASTAIEYCEIYFTIVNLFQPEKDPEPRDTNFQTKLSSQHLKIKVPSSQQKSTLESSAGRSVTKVLLPQPLETALVSTGLLLTNS